MKKIFCLLIAFVVISPLLMATGQQQGSSSSGKVEIRASYWGDTGRFDLYDRIIKEFEKVHTNVTVIREPVSWNDYWDKLAVQVAGGNATDFLCMHPQYSADYIPRGVMEPLDKYISDGVISLAGWSPSIVDTGKYNGQTFMLAMGVTFSSAFVNAGAIKQLGLTPPPFEWSWDDAKALGLQARRALDAQGRRNAWLIGTQITNLNSFRYFARQRNREVYDQQGNISVTAQDVEDWYAMWKEFQDLGIVPDAATSTEYFSVTLENSLFAKDMALVTWVPVNQFMLYCNTFPNKELAVVRHPGSKGNAYVGEFPEGAHFGVYARSTPEKKLAAAQLLNFWLNDARSLTLFKLDQGVPANEPIVRQSVIPILDKNQNVAVDFVNTLSKISRSTIYPPPGASEIDTLFRTKGEQVQYGTKTPAQAAKEFYDEAVAIRNRARR